MKLELTLKHFKTMKEWLFSHCERCRCREGCERYPLPFFPSKSSHDTALHVPLCACVFVCPYTTCAPLDPTLIIIRLVIDHAQALSIDPGVCSLVEGHETLSPGVWRHGARWSYFTHLCVLYSWQRAKRYNLEFLCAKKKNNHSMLNSFKSYRNLDFFIKARLRRLQHFFAVCIF